MNAVAISSVSDARISLLDSTCQASLKQLSCIGAYPTCEGVDVTNRSTYVEVTDNNNNIIGSLPFKRPCKLDIRNHFLSLICTIDHGVKR